MADRDIFVDSWQMRLFDEHPVWEATLRIGLIPTHDHVQMQIEVHDPRSKVLAAMKSWPHVQPDALPQLVDRAMSDLAHALAQVGVPAKWLEGMTELF